MNKSRYWILVLALVFGNTLFSQIRRNTVEVHQNQKALATDKAQLERDVNELTEYKSKLEAFNIAYSAKDAVKAASLKSELIAIMKREIEQSENKVLQDKQELTQSNSEVHASVRETRRSRFDRATIDNDSKDGYDVRDDRRDRRDDQRDAVDDKSDLNNQITRTSRQKAIYGALLDFSFSFEPSIMDKELANKNLMSEFGDIMSADIAATKAEIAEDKREAAEDGRERREDRWERREKVKNW